MSYWACYVLVIKTVDRIGVAVPTPKYLPISYFDLKIPKDIPKKSATTDNAPIHNPPNAAAVGIYLFSSCIIDFSRCPLMTICWSLSCLAT